MDEKEKLYNLLKETFILLDDGDRKLFGTYKLTPPRFYALTHIHEEPGLSSSKLSDRLLCDKSNVTRIVKGLEAEGLITRSPHETDGRALRLYLTELGAKVLVEVQQAHHKFNAQRLNCLDSISQGDLLQNLSKLNESLLSALIQIKDKESENGNLA